MRWLRFWINQRATISINVVRVIPQQWNSKSSLIRRTNYSFASGGSVKPSNPENVNWSYQNCSKLYAYWYCTCLQTTDANLCLHLIHLLFSGLMVTTFQPVHSIIFCHTNPPLLYPWILSVVLTPLCSHTPSPSALLSSPKSSKVSTGSLLGNSTCVGCFSAGLDASRMEMLLMILVFDLAKILCQMHAAFTVYLAKQPYHHL